MSGADIGRLRPRPVPDEYSRAFWDGAANGILVLQRCRSCGHFIHPPFPECTDCRSGDLGFEAVRGTGTIFERVIVESPVVVGFEDAVPYACLLVELDEQPRLLMAGNLVDAAPEEALVGRRVRTVFRAEADGFVLPQFALTGEDER